MRIIVHRGTHQIGGTCIEIAAGTSRIVLDAGLPLEADLTEGALLPVVPGLFNRDGPPVDGLFVSHANADHTGLVSASRAQVPVWLSDCTSKMILAGSLFARQPTIPRGRRRTLVAGQPVSIGPFRVTAYPVDHSVFDAMAFLVEAEGQRILYTGDLRFHGRKPGMARQLAKIAKQVPLDALLIEGTRLGGRSGEANVDGGLMAPPYFVRYYGENFLKYDPANGFVDAPFTATDSFGVNNGTDIVNLTAGGAVPSGGASVFALRTNGALTGTGTINIVGGGLILAAGGYWAAPGPIGALGAS